jgi:hypothetical protein
MTATRWVRIAIVTLAGALAFGCGDAAWAYWTANGTGHGSATTAVAEKLTLSPGVITSELYPGGSGDVFVVASNPNDFAMAIGSLSLDPTQGTGGFAVDPDHDGCAVGALSFTTQTTGWSVPARSGSTDGTLPITLPGALSMSIDAANACQGATITVYLTAGS